MTNEKVQERNDLIFKLAMEGLRSTTILQQVNRAGLQHEWQPLDSVRSVQRVVHDRLAKERPVPAHKLREYQDNMFYAEMEQLALLREKLALHRIRKQRWQPFEFFKHIESEFKLLQRMIELYKKKQAQDAAMPRLPAQTDPETGHQRQLQPVLRLLDECLEMQPA